MTEALKRKITENPMAMLYLVIVACGTFFYNYQKSCDESATEYRKMLAEMAIHHPQDFNTIVEKVRATAQ